MSIFMSTLPKHSKSNGGKQKSLVMTLKPCPDEKSYYRVRLLAFAPPPGSMSDRDDPFIERFVHQHWTKDPDKGYNKIDAEVVCPVTPHVHVEGNRYDACKICTLANKYFIAFKESNWKDKDANRKNKDLGRKYQAIVPVYVVNNPNWEGDNGKFRVIIFNDKKVYQDFRKRVERAALENPVFNGTGAVDCCLHVKEDVEVLRPGQPNEYKWKKRVIDRIVFSTKPYDIGAITQDAIISMGFDDEYYTSSTPDELNAFYQKYCTVSNDDIPDADEVRVYDNKPADAKPVDAENSAAAPVVPADDLGDLDDLTKDSDNLPATTQKSTAAAQVPAAANDDIDAEKLLAGLDI